MSNFDETFHKLIASAISFSSFRDKFPRVVSVRLAVEGIDLQWGLDLRLTNTQIAQLKAFFEMIQAVQNAEIEKK